MTARILVAGPRSWSADNPTQASIVRRALAYHHGAHLDATLVHGAARGVDTMAADLWTAWGLPVEGHPVTELDYSTAGMIAPLLRNTHMVNLGATLMLAFRPDHWTPGTRDCVMKAREAGIPVYVHNQSS